MAMKTYSAFYTMKANGMTTTATATFEAASFERAFEIASDNKKRAFKKGAKLSCVRPAAAPEEPCPGREPERRPIGFGA